MRNDPVDRKNSSRFINFSVKSDNMIAVDDCGREWKICPRWGCAHWFSKSYRRPARKGTPKDLAMKVMKVYNLLVNNRGAMYVGNAEKYSGVKFSDVENAQQYDNFKYEPMFKSERGMVSALPIYEVKIGVFGATRVVVPPSVDKIRFIEKVSKPTIRNGRYGIAFTTDRKFSGSVVVKSNGIFVYNVGKTGFSLRDREFLKPAVSVTQLLKEADVEMAEKMEELDRLDRLYVKDVEGWGYGSDDTEPDYINELEERMSEAEMRKWNELEDYLESLARLG